MQKYRYYSDDDKMRELCLDIANNFTSRISGDSVVKNDRKSTVIRVQTGNHIMYCKRFNRGGLFYSLKNQFRISKARRALNTANIIRSLGIPTPDHIAAIEEKSAGFLKASYLFTEAIENGEHSDIFFGNHFGKDPQNIKMKHRFIKMMARFVASVHRQCILHPDLKAPNLIVRYHDDRYIFYLLDLDGIEIKDSLPEKQVIKNLAQLNNNFQYVSSESDRLRFFVCYLRESLWKMDREKIRDILKTISELTHNIVKRWKREVALAEIKGLSKHRDDSIPQR